MSRAKKLRHFSNYWLIIHLHFILQDATACNQTLLIAHYRNKYFPGVVTSSILIQRGFRITCHTSSAVGVSLYPYSLFLLTYCPSMQWRLLPLVIVVVCLHLIFLHAATTAYGLDVANVTFTKFKLYPGDFLSIYGLSENYCSIIRLPNCIIWQMAPTPPRHCCSMLAGRHRVRPHQL